ncbi:MAG TPA: hypothetical protein VLG37_01685 [Candidatus Saccharimonadales bacterium]|nr:hypothetical protein [Candidatus Saccharimonadales bacterium]
MNAKQFLTLGGIVLLLVGILGFVGVIGPTPAQSIFGKTWYFDNTENVIHTVLGVAALALVLLKLKALYEPVTLLVGLAALFFGILNFFLGSSMPNIGNANLESPADLILHLGVGVWALSAWWMSRDAPAVVE